MRTKAAGTVEAAIAVFMVVVTDLKNAILFCVFRQSEAVAFSSSGLYFLDPP